MYNHVDDEDGGMGARRTVVDELMDERAALIDEMRASLSAEDLLAATEEIPRDIIKGIRLSREVMLRGDTTCPITRESPERVLLMAILVKKELVKQGFKVEIQDPDMDRPFSRRGFTKSLAISGWIK